VLVLGRKVVGFVRPAGQPHKADNLVPTRRNISFTTRNYVPSCRRLIHGRCASFIPRRSRRRSHCLLSLIRDKQRRPAKSGIARPMLESRQGRRTAGPRIGPAPPRPARTPMAPVGPFVPAHAPGATRERRRRCDCLAAAPPGAPNRLRGPPPQVLLKPRSQAAAFEIPCRQARRRRPIRRLQPFPR